MKKYEYIHYRKINVNDSNVRTGDIVELESMDKLNKNHWKEVETEEPEIKPKKRGGK